jgi:hypothetical protein
MAESYKLKKGKIWYSDPQKRRKMFSFLKEEEITVPS